VIRNASVPPPRYGKRAPEEPLGDVDEDVDVGVADEVAVPGTHWLKSCSD
jgi:hypothetical protein